MVELRAKRVLDVRQVPRALEQPIPLGCIHLKEDSVAVRVQEAAAVDNPSFLLAEIDRAVGLVRERRGQNHSLTPRWVFHVNDALHAELASLRNRRSNAVVVAVGGGAQPLNLLAFEHVFALELRSTVVPEILQRLTRVVETAGDDDEEFVLAAVLGVGPREGVVYPDPGGHTLTPNALIGVVL